MRICCSHHVRQQVERLLGEQGAVRRLHVHRRHAEQLAQLEEPVGVGAHRRRHAARAAEEPVEQRHLELVARERLAVLVHRHHHIAAPLVEHHEHVGQKGARVDAVHLKGVRERQLLPVHRRLEHAAHLAQVRRHRERDRRVRVVAQRHAPHVLLDRAVERLQLERDAAVGARTLRRVLRAQVQVFDRHPRASPRWHVRHAVLVGEQQAVAPITTVVACTAKNSRTCSACPSHTSCRFAMSKLEVARTARVHDALV